MARDQRGDLLLLCVAGHILMAVGRVQQLFPALEALRPALLTGALAIAMYLLDRREVRRSRYLLVPAAKYLIALLVWMMVCIPTAIWPGNSFDMVVANFIKTVVMFFVVAGSVRGVRDVERLAAVYLASAAVYAAVVVSRFHLGQGDDWRLDHLYYYDSNDFATLIVTAIPFALYFLSAGRDVMSRALSVAGLVVLTLGFVYAGSRGGFIALMAVAGFIVLRYTGIALHWRVAAATLVAVVLLGSASDQYWDHMGSILSDADYNRTAETGRLQIWQRGVGYMLQYPILGVGPANFQAAEGMLSPIADRQQFGIGVRWSAPHNVFIQAGAELGLPGLLLFVGFIVTAFGGLRHSARQACPTAGSPCTEVQLTQAFTASLIGFVVGSFFLSLLYAEMLYTIVALSVGLYKVTAGKIVSAKVTTGWEHR